MAGPGAAKQTRNPEGEPWSCGSRGISVVALHLIPLNFITPNRTATATSIVRTRTSFLPRAPGNPCFCRTPGRSPAPAPGVGNGTLAERVLYI